MGLKTPVINGARQELPCLESPEVNGARQAISAVNKYVDGAWQKIWPMEEYIIKDGRLNEERSIISDKWTSYHSNTHLDPDLSIINAYKGSYYCVILGDYFESSDTGWTGGALIDFGKVDLTKYSTLWYEFEYYEMEPISGDCISSEHRLLVSDSYGSTGTELAYASYYGRSENGHLLGKIDLDLTTLSHLENVYVKLYVTYNYSGNTYSTSRNHEVDIYNMWLE